MDNEVSSSAMQRLLGMCKVALNDLAKRGILVRGGKRGTYNCMMAEGYELGDMCEKAVTEAGFAIVGIEISSCWYPDNWWERWKRR